MEQTITKLKLKNESGLVLIDYPTGVGKTYKAIEYIKNHIDENIFFITPLKKNVVASYNDLRNMLKDNDLFDSNVILLKSNFDNIIENIMNVKNYNDEIIQWDSFNDLKNLCISYNQSKNEIIKDNILKAENIFRKELEKYFQKFNTLNERKNEIVKSHNWLLQLYPGINLEKKKIIFMTFDKFLSGNTSIVQPTYKFVDSKLVKDSIVFVDEIDSTSDRVLNHEIEDVLRNNFNLISLFRNAYYSLNKKFPRKLFIPSNSSKMDEEFYKSIIDDNRMIFQSIYEKYNLNYLFKTDDKNKAINLIFNDQTYIDISSFSGKELYVVTDEEDNYNYIKSMERNDKNINFIKLLGDIKGAINYLFNGISFLSLNYYQKVYESSDFQLQEAVRQVLELFNLRDYNLIQKIISIINTNMLKKKGIKTRIFDTDFYNRGYRYFEFKEHNVSSLKTDISFYELNNTPEKFLITLASKAYVVGLSATGTMRTVIGNYNLDYIENELKERYYKLDREDTERINGYIKSRLDMQNNHIIVEAISEERINMNSEDLEYIKGKLNNISFNENEYALTQFKKVITAVLKFINNTKSIAMLILTNRNYLTDYKNLNIKNIKEIITVLGVDLSNIEMIEMNSNNFDNAIVRYKNDIKNNKKVILFSSYNTVGIGQNLQYELNGKNYDIDTIYLEKPTNLLVNYNDIKDDSDNSNLMKYIYQMETLKSNGEISFKACKNAIRHVFYNKYNIKNNSKSEQYSTVSFKVRQMAILIQAVGRICRCNDVEQYKSIYVDEDIFTKLDFSVLDDRIYNREFQAIIEKSNEINSTNRYELINKKIVKAETENKNLYYFINNFLSNEWTELKIKEWIGVRDFVLRYPTISNEVLDLYPQYDNLFYKNGSVKINKYYYLSEFDFKDISISLMKLHNYHEVSDVDCHLDRIKNIEFIKKKFEFNNYPLSFDINENIVLPIIYNNIYKGALGEFIGKVILEHYGIELKEITDPKKFEKFDYIYKNCFIDFKYWNYNNYDIEIDKIKHKLLKIHGKKAVVINIFGNDSSVYTIKENILIIPNLINNDGSLNVKNISKIESFLKEE